LVVRELQKPKCKERLQSKPHISWYEPQPFHHLQKEIGIVVQGIGNILFTFAAAVLWYRTHHNCKRANVPTPFPKTQKFKLFVAAIIISDAAIIMRAVYRVIELAQGWRGHLITTQYYFYILDTAPMIVCMLIWVIGHPGFTLDTALLHASLRTKKYEQVKQVDVPLMEVVRETEYRRTTV
jgi:RTA1 like protein